MASELTESLLRVVAEGTVEIPVKPWQRLACLLYASGTPLEDVARELGKRLDEVTDFVTSARGIALLKVVVTENPERMDALIEATTLDSIMKMVRVRDLGKTEQAQLSAAGQLLDRFLPKVKATTNVGRHRTDPTVDVEKEISRLRAEVQEKVD